LSLVCSPQAISTKLSLPVRTVYAILAKRDNPRVEARREEKRIELVDRVWSSDEVNEEALKLKAKMDLILDSLNPEKAAKARLTELSISYGVLLDKRQLLIGKPTQNVGVLTAIIQASEKLHKQAFDKEIIPQEGKDLSEETKNGSTVLP
jgi:hypothetical protein